MHRAVAEFTVAEHAVTGNDHLELIGLVEVRSRDFRGVFSAARAASTASSTLTLDTVRASH
jgi:hypothetical protein